MDQRPATIIDAGSEQPLGAGRSISGASSVDERGDIWITHELVNDGDDLLADFVRPWTVRLAVTGGPDDHRAMVHGFHSFSGSGSYSFAEAPPLIGFKPSRVTTHNMFAPPSGRRGTLVSSMFTTVCRGDRSEAITVGTCDPRHHVTQVIATWQGDAIEISVQVQLERRVLRRGDRLALPPVFVSHAPPDVAQRRWALRVAEHLALAPTRPSPDGYCSWYSRYTKITEANLLADLDAVETTFGNGFELFHVDDGYQSAVGDWLSPDDGFPRGVGVIAQAAARHDKAAGLWLAPFVALAGSQLVRSHPGWLLRNERGRPVTALLNPQWDRRHPVRTLDVTHPGVLEHLGAVMRELVASGFSFFKLDFLFASMLPGVRHDPSLTSLEGARAALEAIRAAVGPDAFLLGCGCPIEAGIGTVDLMRTSADVTPIWRAPLVTRFVGGDAETLGSNVAHRSVLARAFLHRVFFENDPDCLFAYRTRNRLTVTEMRLMAHANGLSGGPVMFATVAGECDGVEAEMVEVARRVNREVREGATRWWSPDAMTRFHPGLLAAAGEHTGWLAIANVADVVCDVAADLAEIFGWPAPRIEIIDAARPERVEMSGESVLVRGLDAHDSVLLRVHETAV